MFDGYSTLGRVTPAMTHHRTRADEWLIPHTGRVPLLPGSVLDPLEPGRVVCCHRSSVAWLSGVGSRPQLLVLGHVRAARRHSPVGIGVSAGHQHPALPSFRRREADVSGSPRHNRCAAATLPQHICALAENHCWGTGFTVITRSGRPSSGPSRRVHRGRLHGTCLTWAVRPTVGRGQLLDLGIVGSTTADGSA